MYGKQTETAIAALAALAEVYDGGKTRLSAAQIAKNRLLQGPSVAKSLTTLSQAGLVQGIPGPGGGYWLAKQPDQITLYDAYKIFEREDSSKNCPFGGGECGSDDPCAIHHKLVNVQSAVQSLLKGTSLDTFKTQTQPANQSTPTSTVQLTSTRESFRANKSHSS